MDTDTHIEPEAFGDLLRAHRLAASLTQEELAERAGLSARGISDLERGARTQPYRETLKMLAAALDLGGDERNLFYAAARPASRAPRLRVGRATAFPMSLSGLIGRSAEIAAVTDLLRDDEVRLVTLTGPGGVGKTRLALAVAERMNREFLGGRVFVDLAPFHHPSNVVTAIATALGVSERSTALPIERVQQALGSAPLLLMLDNFEHLMGAATVVSDLLHVGSGVKALVTSREALHLQGEHEYLVQPLDLPNELDEPRFDAIAGCSAVDLFVRRTLEADRQFRLTRENATEVAAICRRLDGLPLAIELAAARMKVLSPAALLSRLEQSLPLLTGGPRDVPARQRTLRDAIAWSYDLLEPEEQVLFSRLGAFAGGWTLDAAEAVGEETSRDGVIGGLESLVDKSLVRRHEGLADARFAMLETIREFALERLADDRRLDASARRAHADHFLALAGEAREGLIGTDQEDWLRRLDAEDGNLRAALAWTLECGSADAALSFASALWRYWSPRGRLRDGRFWLERALAREDALEAPADARAKAHNALGNLLGDSGELARAREQFEAALVFRRDAGDIEGIAGTVNNLGLVAMWMGDYDDAERLHNASLAMRRARDDQFGEALSLSNLGDVKTAIGDLTLARELQEAALRLRESVRDAAGCAYSHYNLGEISRLEGHLPEATHRLEESLHRFEILGDRLGIAYAEWSLASVAISAGNVGRAGDLLERVLETRAEIGDQRGFVECLEVLGLLALSMGSVSDGVSLLGIAREQRNALGYPLAPSSSAEHERALATARQTHGAAKVEVLLYEGRRDPAKTVKVARRVIELAEAADGPPSPS